MAAAVMARARAQFRSSAARLLYHRSVSTPTATAASSPSQFLGSGLTRHLRPSPVPPFIACALRQIRFRVNRAGDSAYSPLQSAPRSGSNAGERPAIENGPLFPGCDYEHWLIVMDKPGGEGASKQQMIDCYVQTLAKVLGSEEEAKKKIYNVSCERYFGFGCELDEETSNKLEGLPGVLFVLPDSYVDVENKDYGAELFINGEIVQRPPERQRKIDSIIQRSQQDRPNRTKYMRRRENQR